MNIQVMPKNSTTIHAYALTVVARCRVARIKSNCRTENVIKSKFCVQSSNFLLVHKICYSFHNYDTMMFPFPMFTPSDSILNYPDNSGHKYDNAFTH